MPDRYLLCSELPPRKEVHTGRVPQKMPPRLLEKQWQGAHYV
jgi:hypothetical protein